MGLYRFADAPEAQGTPESFDSPWYLATNDDVRVAGVNPLFHYLHHGMHEGRKPAPDAASDRSAGGPFVCEPTEDEWRAAARARAASHHEAVVDVIVPLCAGRVETLRAICNSLTATNETRYNVIVVAGGPSRDAKLTKQLKRLARRNLIQFMRKPAKLGLLDKINRAVQMHPLRDVVLLSPDTEVYGDWLDRLRAAAYSAERVGTVTPLTTNGTICSYPHTLRSNDTALELTYEELDQLAREANRGLRVPIPTGVGFCMYIRRACLEEAGLFEPRTRRGFDEGNDFSLRALRRGWQHLLAGDVFVRRLGSASMGAEKETLLANLGARDEFHEGYAELITEFVRNDPHAGLRRRLDIARITRANDGRCSVAHLIHGIGGGADTHVRELADLLVGQDVGSVILRGTGAAKAAASYPGIEALPNLDFDLTQTEGRHSLLSVLQGLQVRHMHIHHLLGFGEHALEWAQELASDLGVEYDLTLHDYTVLCPRIHLSDFEGQFCDVSPTPRCDECVSQAGSPFGTLSVGRWRSDHEALLQGARRVFAPSRDTANRVSANCRVSPTVKAHPEPNARPEPIRVAARRPGTLGVTVIGTIGVLKGSRVIRDCAADAQRRGLPIRFSVVGFTDDDSLFSCLSNVTITGPYAGYRQGLQLIQDAEAQVAWFPSIVPETYSYTLSMAFDAGLFPVVFDVGAQAERVRQEGFGYVLPYSLIEAPQRINDALVGLSWEETELPGRGEPRYPDLMRDYYELEWPRSSSGCAPGALSVIS